MTLAVNVNGNIKFQISVEPQLLTALQAIAAGTSQELIDATSTLRESGDRLQSDIDANTLS